MAEQKNQPANKPKRASLNMPKVDWAGAMLGRVGAWFNKFWSNANHFARTNYEIGVEQMVLGNLKDAQFRFKVATWAEPNHYLAWYNLGCVQYALGKPKDAMVALRRALLINPKSQDARYMLFTIDSKILPREQMPITMPAAILESQFNLDGDAYEQWHLQVQGYRAHRALADAVLREIDPARSDYAMLDLGCGTGLCGVLLRPKAQLMMGVDSAPSLAKHAAEARDATGRKIYDDVRMMDLREFLAQIKEPIYDVIFASNVFNYVGDLAAVFDGVSRALRTNGIFAFNTDIPEVTTGYQIIPVLGRYGHSEAYLREQEVRTGFLPLGMGRITAYNDFPMLQCLLRKA